MFVCWAFSTEFKVHKTMCLAKPIEEDIILLDFVTWLLAQALSILTSQT
jgi:hypothetical protein